MSSHEKSNIKNLTLGQLFDNYAQMVNIMAAIAHHVPETTIGMAAGSTYGGRNIGDSMQAIAGAFGFVASQFRFIGKSILNYGRIPQKER